jgi:hypothetical protein
MAREEFVEELGPALRRLCFRRAGIAPNQLMVETTDGVRRFVKPCSSRW